MKPHWEKFKQSNIARIFIGYSAVSWILIQLIEAVLPTFEAPLWVAQTLTFLLILGFPIALLIGWASESFSKNHDDFNNEENVESDPQEDTALTKKSFWIIGSGAVILVGLFGFYMMPFIFDHDSFEKQYSGSANSSDYDPDFRGFRTQIYLGELSPNDWGLDTEIAISDDSRYLAFTKNKDGFSEILLRDLNFENDVKKLAEYTWGTDVHGVLSFSPDNNWLYFLDAGLLKRASLQGPTIQTIVETPLNATSGYDPHDKFIIYTGRRNWLDKIEISAGKTESLPFFEKNAQRNIFYRWPELLPGGTHLLFSMAPLGATLDGDVVLYDMNTGNHKTILNRAYNARYSPSEHIVFVRDSSIWAVPFDLSTMELNGNARLIVENVQSQGQLGSAAYAFSKKGTLFYLKGSDTYQESKAIRLSWVKRNGDIEPITLPNKGRISGIRLSPAGDQISYTEWSSTSNSDVWIWDIDKEIASRRTFSGKAAGGTWAKSGASLIYNERSIGKTGIWEVDSNGAGKPYLLAETNGFSYPQEVGPAKEKLLVYSNEVNQSGAYVLSTKEDNSLEKTMIKLDLAPANGLSIYSQPTISPDGNWIAYSSAESGVMQLYIRPYPKIETGKWQISFGNALSPIWSPTSQEIFFWSGSSQYSTPYQLGPNNKDGRPNFIDLGIPKKMFSVAGLQNGLTLPAWDYEASSDRFLMLETSTRAALKDSKAESEIKTQHLYVIENWFKELRASVPPLK